jgi:hypothetical protein
MVRDRFGVKVRVKVRHRVRVMVMVRVRDEAHHVRRYFSLSFAFFPFFFFNLVSSGVVLSLILSGV